MGLLDGGIAEIFAAAFDAIYLDGTLYRSAAFADDGMGGGTGMGFAPGEPVKVQIDSATDEMRADVGFVEGDMRLLMLAHGIIAPDTDAEVLAGGSSWQIQTVSTDAAGSYFEMRGRRKAGA